MKIDVLILMGIAVTISIIWTAYSIKKDDEKKKEIESCNHEWVTKEAYGEGFFSQFDLYTWKECIKCKVNKKKWEDGSWKFDL
jgi:hypothetical protein